MCLIAQIKGLSALIKDIYSVLMCPQKKIMANYCFCQQRTSNQLFHKILNRFEQTRSQMKAYQFTFLSKRKIQFFLQNFEIYATNVFIWHQIFLYIRRTVLLYSNKLCYFLQLSLFFFGLFTPPEQRNNQ